MKISYFSRRGLEGPNTYEFISRFFTNFHDHGILLGRKYGKFYGSSFPIRVVTINDPDLIHTITVKHFHIFSQRVNWNLGDVPRRMIVFMEANDDWKRVRSILTHAFTSTKLQNSNKYLNNISDNLIHKLKELEANGKRLS